MEKKVPPINKEISATKAKHGGTAIFPQAPKNIKKS